MKRANSEARKEFSLDGCFVCQDGGFEAGCLHPQDGTVKNIVGYIQDHCRYGEQIAQTTCSTLISWLEDGHDVVELAGAFCHRECYGIFNNASMRDRAEKRYKTTLESGV